MSSLLQIICTVLSSPCRCRVHDPSSDTTPTTSGQTSLLKTMTKLEISQNEATKFYQLFESIDKDHNGTIEVREFFDYFKIEMDAFGIRTFGVMDFNYDGDGKFTDNCTIKQNKHSKKQSEITYGDTKLPYDTFFLSLYNFCTLTNETLIKFTFDLYDVDKSGTLTVNEVYKLVEVLYPGSSKKYWKKEGAKLMKIMDKDLDDGKTSDGFVTFPEFMIACRSMMSITMPAFHLQRKIRKGSMSEAFWKRATKKRLRILPSRPFQVVYNEWKERRGVADFGVGEEAMGGESSNLIMLYKQMQLESSPSFIPKPAETSSEDKGDEDEDEEENDVEIDEGERQRAIAELRKIKEQKGKEIHDWATAPQKVRVRHAKERKQHRREGGWWTETPSIRGAKIHIHMHDDGEEPRVVIEKGVADLLVLAEESKRRGVESVKKARRTRGEVEVEVEVVVDRERVEYRGGEAGEAGEARERREGRERRERRKKRGKSANAAISRSKSKSSKSSKVRRTKSRAGVGGGGGGGRGKEEEKGTERRLTRPKTAS